MGDIDYFYFRHSYGEWCQLCVGSQQDLECYILNFDPHYLDPSFPCNQLKMGEIKNDHYYPPVYSQPSLPTNITSNELCQMEERILQKLKQIDLMVKMRYLSQD
ncbi:hypothetical protein Hanom_Chr12g01145981 [Helianthus anomalus]